METEYSNKRKLPIMIKEELLKKCLTDSEKATAQFFYKLGLECIDLCFKIQAEDGSDVTDIDGIFLDNENKVIFIYDDSKQKNDSNSKIALFFNKCSQTKYEQQIYDSHVNLPHYPIKILYIDKSRNSLGANVKKGSIGHTFSEHTSILFKDDFEYFESLISKIGKWAKNDLYNFLEIRLPNARIEVDAIKIYIGNTPAYLFSAKPHDILKYSFVARRRNNEEGYQRMVDFNRAREIADKLKSGEISGFMNSILLNSTIPLEEKQNISKSHTPKNVKLIISNHFSSCKIVDGQHRLISFAYLDEIQQSKYSVPVVLLDNLSNDQEKHMFLEINKNAKSVDPNLEYEISSDINDWKIDSPEYKTRLAVLTIKKLSNSAPIKDNVFYGKVGENKSDSITLKAFADLLVKHNYIDRNKNIFNKSIANEKDVASLADDLKPILGLANEIIKDKEFLISNRGIQLILGYVADELTQEDFDSNEVFIQEVRKFLIILNQETDELKFSKQYGSSAYKTHVSLIKQKYATINSGPVVIIDEKDGVGLAEPTEGSRTILDRL